MDKTPTQAQPGSGIRLPLQHVMCVCRVGLCVCMIVFIVANRGSFLFLWTCGDSVNRPECRKAVREMETWSLTRDVASIDRRDTVSMTGFKMDKDVIKMLNNTKSPCFLERQQGNRPHDAYAWNAYRTKKHHKQKCFSDVINTLAPTYVTLRNGQDYRLRCLPYFMLIGQPKCGTTDLFWRLTAHARIALPWSEEVYWWSHLRFSISATLSDYSDLFDNTVVRMLNETAERFNLQHLYETVSGEMTTVTMSVNPFIWSDPENDGLPAPRRTTADFVRAVLPDVKLLVMLRNPTARLYSHFYMWCTARHPALECSPELFHKLAVNSIGWWRNCTAKHELRYCLYASPVDMAPVEADLSSWWPKGQLYSGTIREGLYYYYITDWTKVFPRDQFLFIRTETYGTNPPQFIKDNLLPFLGVTFENSLLRDRHRFLSKSRQNVRSYKPMLNETRTLLDQFYKPTNQLLAKLLQDSSWEWKDES